MSVATTTQTTVEIYPEQLQVILSRLRAATFAGIEYDTEPDNVKAPKTSGMAGRIRKRVHITPIVGKSLSYLSVINRRRVREGKPPVGEVQPRKWGMRIPGSPFVVHKNQFYLESLVESCQSVDWFLDGEQVDYSVVKPFLREKPKSNLYNLEDENIPCWRTIRLDHITAVTVDGCTYRVVQRS